MITLIMLAAMLLLMIIRVPVSISIGVAAAIGVFMTDTPMELVARSMIGAVNSFTLLAVPFFVLAGNLMNYVGMTDRIFEFARRLLGHMHGGLAHVNVGASMIFAGMSGTALADLAGLGAIEIKAMRENGYHPALAASITLASCTIGVIVPPSISFIVYCLVTGESTGRLFIAGIIPGFLIGLLLMIYIYAWARIKPQYFQPPEKFNLVQLYGATRRSALALILPFIIVASLLGGVATPTEVGVIAVAYTLVIGFIYKVHSIKRLYNAIVQSATTTALIMYIVAVSAVISWVVTAERSAHEAAESITKAVGSPLAALGLINIFLIVAGMVMEGLPALLITASILYPVVTSIGIDPVHFGVIISFNLIIGIITPPMGIGLFIAGRVANVPVDQVLKYSTPFLIPLLISLAVITLFPQISLWLPDLLMGPRL
jgi:tripartite ATP-independent transporter DctM subunit|tara:strand:- start:535 stop:1824 length:1290 start_codon:yes stop_codon:yes gene_type:complete